MSPVRSCFVTSIPFLTRGPGAKRVAEFLLHFVVDLGHEKLDNVVLELSGVVEDFLAFGSDPVSDLRCDLSANGLTTGAEVVLDKTLPDHGCEPLSALVGGVEDLSDEVVDAGFGKRGDHCAAQVCEHGGIKGT